MKLLLFSVLTIFHFGSVKAEILLDGKFSRSDPSVYKSFQTNGKDYTGQAVAQGFKNQLTFFDNYGDSYGKVARFDLHRSDTPTWNRMRTELVAPDSPRNTELWYGFGVLVPDRVTTTESHVTVFQIHDQADIGENGARYPTLDITVDATNSMRILNSYDSDLITTAAGVRSMPNVDYVHRELAAWELVPGEWNYIAMQAKWASGDTGLLNIWRNGHLVFSENNHPNTFNDELGVYAKIGVYTPGRENDWSTLSAYHTGLVLGDARENFSTIQAAIVPEPNLYMMILSGICVLVFYSRRRIGTDYGTR